MKLQELSKNNPISDEVVQEVLKVANLRRRGCAEKALASCSKIHFQQAVCIFPCGTIGVGKSPQEDHAQIFYNHNRVHTERNEPRDVMMVSGETLKVTQSIGKSGMTLYTPEVAEELVLRRILYRLGEEEIFSFFSQKIGKNRPKSSL